MVDVGEPVKTVEHRDLSEAGAAVAASLWRVGMRGRPGEGAGAGLRTEQPGRARAPLSSKTVYSLTAAADSYSSRNH